MLTTIWCAVVFISAAIFYLADISIYKSSRKQRRVRLIANSILLLLMFLLIINNQGSVFSGTGLSAKIFFMMASAYVAAQLGMALRR